MADDTTTGDLTVEDYRRIIRDAFSRAQGDLIANAELREETSEEYRYAYWYGYNMGISDVMRDLGMMDATGDVVEG